jgi:hypothetical protein
MAAALAEYRVGVRSPDMEFRLLGRGPSSFSKSAAPARGITPNTSFVLASGSDSLNGETRHDSFEFNASTGTTYP